MSLPMLQKVRDRATEMRDKAKTRIAEWKERGWRPPETQSRPRLQIFKEVKEKGLLSAIRARREGTHAQRRTQTQSKEYRKEAAIEGSPELKVQKPRISIEA